MAEALAFYTVDEAYADYLVPHTPQLFRSARVSQAYSRKYVGVVLAVGGHDYFAPLSSFKDKHRRMKNGLDFVKVKDMAVVNLNNMFPCRSAAARGWISRPSATGSTGRSCRRSIAP